MYEKKKKSPQFKVLKIQTKVFDNKKNNNPTQKIIYVNKKDAITILLLYKKKQ